MQLMEVLILLLNMLILMIGVLVAVAFFTLLERKFLGYIQFRKGPNKLGLIGIVQPFSDAIKLFAKEFYFPFKSNMSFYLISPIFSLFLSLMIWLIFPYLEGLNFLGMGFLFFLCLLSFGVYLVMMSGWSSNSNFSFLGGVRAIVQTISYEVSLIFLFLSVIILVMNFNLINIFIYQQSISFFYFMIPIGLMIFVSLLAECNRTPFDFSEGESELVSGFNVEYGGSMFALLFLSEYASILFMSLIYVIFFWGSSYFGVLMFLKISVIASVFIWVRGTLPRYRYDKLMGLTWKIFLPVSLGSFMLLVNILNL
uniref:NADH-ubiquinone oxidoreductase chain 1 n=1 Tax=Cheumatopsyche speciosa TaxID=763295 RepID=A0A3G1NDK2_9NEOP|nr:NADH dehydrogenase subunit 1 [Cheumatopsyche speciosa]AUT18172.1 NADH dehydrogenase subunit 1 [Cheumatopsyche speciosa]